MRYVPNTEKSALHFLLTQVEDAAKQHDLKGGRNMDYTPNTPYERFESAVNDALSTLRKDMDDSGPLCGSRALAFATAAGLPARMSYTVAETARYTGFTRQALRRENEAGRLRFLKPEDDSRGARILVTEVDRWMAETMGIC